MINHMHAHRYSAISAASTRYLLTMMQRLSGCARNLIWWR